MVKKRCSSNSGEEWIITARTSTKRKHKVPSRCQRAEEHNKCNKKYTRGV